MTLPQGEGTGSAKILWIVIVFAEYSPSPQGEGAGG